MYCKQTFCGMAGVFSRFITKYKFSFLLKSFSSQAFTKPEILSRTATEEIHKLSTLFVPGRHGADMYQIVKPDIDINYISDNLGNLKLSCDHRGIEIDLDYVLEVSREWLNIRNHYSTIIDKDQEYVAKIHSFNLLGLTDKVEDLTNERNKFLEILLSEKAKLHDIEDIVMPLFQKIPHILHPNTPLQFNTTDMCKEPITFNFDVKSHTDIIFKQISFIDCTNSSPTSCYMTGKLSELDFGIQVYFADKLSSSGFSSLAGVDFCKSFIIEAIGNDPYSSLDCIQIKGKGNRDVGQKLNLVGGASFETFCAYLANMNVDKSTLPNKYFALGRRYNAANKSSNSQDLFSVVQSTNVHGLIISEHPMNSFDSLLEVITECYSELNIPFRIVNIAAKNLTIAESHRKQLELWSPALKEYVPVAYVSQHDDFVSKRLQITYGSQHVKEGYCTIVEGTIVNISILIGCIIENFQVKDNFNVPTVLEKYITFSE